MNSEILTILSEKSIPFCRFLTSDKSDSGQEAKHSPSVAVELPLLTKPSVSVVLLPDAIMEKSYKSFSTSIR
jgi:hypothetical protein